MLPIQKYTHSLVFISLWTLRVPGKELYCPGIPDWRNKSCEERVDYTQYDLVMEGFFVASAGKISFETKGKHDAHILLQNEPEVYSRNVYEVVLGSDLNRMSVLRSSCHGPCIDDLEIPSILNETEYRPFWITWNTSLAVRTHVSTQNADFVTSTLTTTSTTTETSYSRSTHKGKTDVLLPDRGTTISRKDDDKPSVLTVALATSTGFCFVVILLSTILWVCCLWNERKSTGMGTHSQPNPVGGEHYEGLRGREQELIYQNEEQYASVSV